MAVDITERDELSARSHTLALQLPTREELRHEVSSMINELHAEGGLDEGTFDYMDYHIASKLPTLMALIDQEYRSRDTVTRRLIAADHKNLATTTMRVGRLRDEVSALETNKAAALADLLGIGPLTESEPNTVGAHNISAITPIALPKPADMTALMPLGAAAPDGKDESTNTDIPSIPNITRPKSVFEDKTSAKELS